jgi:hypothetical protein
VNITDQPAPASDDLILEGIVTSLGADGRLNIAPMGPRVAPVADLVRFLLRPFRSSTTYQNLKARPEGVLHVTDNVWLLAQAAIGRLDPIPETMPAQRVHGQVLRETCRWYEFQVVGCDDRGERTVMECRIVHQGRFRDFFGFNRAKHAVVEAAILATRTKFIPPSEILAEMQRLAILVQKTGGRSEHDAFQLLLDYVRQIARQRGEHFETPSPFRS